MRKLSDLEIKELNDCLEQLKINLDYMCVCDSFSVCNFTSELIMKRFEELKNLIYKRFEE